MNDYISCSRFMGANAVHYQISRSRFVVWKRMDERVGELQESWGGCAGSHMESVMAGDAGALEIRRNRGDGPEIRITEKYDKYR